MDTLGSVFYGRGLKAKLMRFYRRMLFDQLDSSSGYCTGGGCTGECPHGALEAAKESYRREELI